MNYFFVFQNKTFREECEGSFLWIQKTLDKQKSIEEKEKILAFLCKELSEEERRENALADEELLDSINENIEAFKITFQYKGVAKKKQKSISIKDVEVQRRDRKVAFNALAYANFLCEVESNHPTFIRKNLDVFYTEPHHLVPLAYAKEFEVSLDVEENVVSLCSNCHNQLHYGKEFEGILKKLYDERKKLLDQVGIHISYERLRKMYL